MTDQADHDRKSTTPPDPKKSPEATWEPKPVHLDSELNFDEARKLPPTSEEFVHAVAAFAWRDGLTAATISKRLQMNDAIGMTKVRRALNRAYGTMLKLVPRTEKELQQHLTQLVRGIGGQETVRFYVVNDNYGPYSGAVSVRAAEVLSEMMTEAAQQEPSQQLQTMLSEFCDDEDLSEALCRHVICNGGGNTLASMVRALQRDPPVDDANDALKKNLLFVAGNAANLNNRFHHSPNFLSVTMAELVGAPHFALGRFESERSLKAHRTLVQHASIFVCGAGGVMGDPEPGLMTRLLQREDIEIPKDAVGDLSFNMLKADGRPVDLPPKAVEFMRRINPTIDTGTIHEIGKQGRVLLVLDGVALQHKVKIAVAAVRGRYATDIVLGSRLATEVYRRLRDIQTDAKADPAAT